jgi:hypothetical protein
MGIGGGFMLVPALIYLIRVPTGVVIGTSMVLTLVTMAYATIIHAATNHLVDALLALLLMIGGVIGAQFGARTGQRFSGEQLRLLLGCSCSRSACACLRPRSAAGRPVHHAHHRGAAMSARRSIALAAFRAALPARDPVAAERLVSTLSTSRVLIASNFTGADVVLFGSVERDAQTVARRGGYDIVVTVTGPRENIVTFRKQRVAASGSMRTSAPSSRHRPISPCSPTARSTTSPTSTRCGAPRPASRARCCRRRSPATSPTRSATIRSARPSCA